MIELTGSDGRNVWINPDKVLFVSVPIGRKTGSLVTFGDEGLYVEETPRQIVDMIRQQNRGGGPRAYP